MVDRDGIVQVAKTFFNIALLFLQLFTFSAYKGMVGSKEVLREISYNLYPNSHLMMNSQIAEHMMSSPVLWFFLAVLIFSVVKEFLLKDQNRKILFNLWAALAMYGFWSMLSYLVYSPIQSMS